MEKVRGKGGDLVDGEAEARESMLVDQTTAVETPEGQELFFITTNISSSPSKN